MTTEPPPDGLLNFCLDQRCTVEADYSESKAFSGYSWWIEGTPAKSKDNDFCDVRLLAALQGGCEGYDLLLDFDLQLLDDSGNVKASLLVQYELVTADYAASNSRESALHVSHRILRSECLPRGGPFVFRAVFWVHEILSATRDNLLEETRLRNFAILVDNRAFYVNIRQLSSIGDGYFQNLMEANNRGVSRAVLVNVSAAEFYVLLTALCRYQKPVITRQAFDTVLWMAQMLRMEKILRRCEMYLVSIRQMHPIRKLEYAMVYSFGILATNVLRTLADGNKGANLEALHDYLIVNGENLSNMHPDVLEALSIFDTFVVI